MAIDTLEELEAALSRDLAWRKKEISGLRISAMRSDDGRNYLFRAGLVLLCAHWEGFLRSSVDLYAKHVFAQRLNLRQLAPVFVGMSYFGDIAKAGPAGYPGHEAFLRLAERILQGLDVVPVRPCWEARTEANPGTGVVRKLLTSVGLHPTLGLDAAAWSTTRVFIDEKVVGDRNRVAHGQGLPLQRDEFISRATRLGHLLEQLSSTVLSAAERRAYQGAP